MSGGTAMPGWVARRTQQNFEHIDNYLIERTWTDASTNKDLAVDRLAAFAVGLGLRNPTEPTSQRVTALFLLCDEGQASAMAMQPAHAREFYNIAKRT
eukprot:5885558-Lingulodinium_polyedra.AAC.1